MGIREELEDLKAELVKEATRLEHESVVTDEADWRVRFLERAEGLWIAVKRIERRIMENEKEMAKSSK